VLKTRTVIEMAKGGGKNSPQKREVKKPKKAKPIKKGKD